MLAQAVERLVPIPFPLLPHVEGMLALHLRRIERPPARLFGEDRSIPRVKEAHGAAHEIDAHLEARR